MAASDTSYAGWKDPKVEGEHPWKRDTKLAVKVDVVGWEEDADSVAMRDKVIPSVVQAGYDANYVEYADWTGPAIITVPHLFYYLADGSIYVQLLGIKTKREVIAYMADPV